MKNFGLGKNNFLLESADKYFSENYVKRIKFINYSIDDIFFFKNHTAED